MSGAIVVWRNRDPFTAPGVGDLVDVYPVLGVVDTWQVADDVMSTLDRSKILPTPHIVAQRESVAFSRERSTLRRLRQRGCDCSKKGRATPLVAAYIRHGRVWFWVRRQSFPAAVVDDVLRDRASADSVWPGHVEPTGTPHVELTTCRACRRHWCVRLSAEGYEMVKLDTPAFGSIVEP